MERTDPERPLDTAIAKEEAFQELMLTFSLLRMTSRALFANFLTKLGGQEEGKIEVEISETVNKLQHTATHAFIVIKKYAPIFDKKILDDASGFVLEMQGLATNVADVCFQKTDAEDQTLMKQRHDEWILRAQQVDTNFPMFCASVSQLAY